MLVIPRWRRALVTKKEASSLDVRRNHGWAWRTLYHSSSHQSNVLNFYCRDASTLWVDQHYSKWSTYLAVEPNITNIPCKMKSYNGRCRLDLCSLFHFWLLRGRLILKIWLWLSSLLWCLLWRVRGHKLFLFDRPTVVGTVVVQTKKWGKLKWSPLAIFSSPRSHA